MLDIKSWVETTGMKTAEERFLKPPVLPYIIFRQDVKVKGADNINCISDRNITIELYSGNIDNVAEEKIERLLKEKSFEYEKDRMWIDKERFFQTSYDFNLLEKNLEG